MRDAGDDFLDAGDDLRDEDLEDLLRDDLLRDEIEDFDDFRDEADELRDRTDDRRDDDFAGDLERRSVTTTSATFSTTSSTLNSMRPFS